MGFFFQTAIEPEPTARPTRKAGNKDPVAKKGIKDGGTGCDACSLKAKWPSLTSPRLAPKGRDDANTLILGSGLTKDGDFKGQHFAGTDFRNLTDILPSRERDNLLYSHAARCFAGDEGPSASNVHACSVHLADDVAKYPIRYILGVGSAALAAFWPGVSIQRVNGTAFPVRLGGKDVWYFPIMDPSFVAEKGRYKNAAGSVFKADVARFFNERKSWGKPRVADMRPSDVITANTEEEARALIDRIEGPLGFDVEASKLKPYERDAKMISAAFSSPTMAVAFAVDHPERRNEWAMPLILETVRKRRWVAHNAGFELTWLLFNMEADSILRNFDDSQAQARLFYDRETIASLADVGVAAMGLNVKTLTGVSSRAILEYPLVEMLPYNGLDAMGSSEIDARLGPKTQGRNYERLLDTMLTTSMMELKGLPIDLDASSKLRTEWGGKDANGRWTGKIASIIESVQGMHEVRQFEMERQRPFSLGSNDDIGIALVDYGRLKLPPRGKGKYVTDDAALTEATKDGDHPLVSAVVEYREATKQVSTYIEPIQAVPERYPDGLLHPSYTVLLTSTGRLSSNEPNVQNFPKRRHRELRRQIVPPKNHLLVPIDYGQIEARVIAMAAQDNFLIESLISGYDIHGAWRDRILDRHPEYWERLIKKTNQTEKAKIMKGGRDIIKTDFVFASFFGATVKSCATRTELPEKIMAEIAGEFWKEFSGVERWIKRQRSEYDQQGLVKTLTGRTRRGVLWGNEPINTPVQGTAADVVLDSMNACRELAIREKEPAFMPRINVHDDLTFFIPDSNDAEAYIETIADVLTEVRYEWQTVPFMVEVSVGHNWADVEEIAKFTGKYRR